MKTGERPVQAHTVSPLGQPFAFSANLAKLVGGAMPAIFLTALVAEMEQSGNEAVRLTVDQIDKRTGLNALEQAEAKQRLTRLGILVERDGLYSVNDDAVEALIN